MAGAVELAQAPEAGRESDLGHAQFGVVEQAAGEVRACRTRQPIRCHAEMRAEETAQVPRRDAEAAAEVRLASSVERAVKDQLHRATDQLGTSPNRELRRPIGPTAQAGPITGNLGGGGKWEPPHVLRARSRRAPGSAVDARRHDTGDRLHGSDIPAWRSCGRSDPDRHERAASGHVEIAPDKASSCSDD